MAEKLIRDLLDRRIPAEQVRIESDPAKVSSALETKLQEELAELSEASFADAGEYADVIEVLLALAARNGVSADAIEAIRQQKRAERGGFDRGLMYNPDGYPPPK